MVTEIRIYFEGDRKLRPGFHAFLNPVLDVARKRGIGFQLVAGGTGGSAIDDFKDALTDHPSAFVVLLVDSEGPVDGGPRQAPSLRLHLEHLAGADDGQLHLMVQLMEAWFVADKEAVARYYGRGFDPNSLPPNPNVEQVPKDDVSSGLKEATRATQKGEYHKTGHAPDLLTLVDPAAVQKAAPHCRLLFDALLKHINQASEGGDKPK